jgi:membrane protein DedA with SNARE-associated domain
VLATLSSAITDQVARFGYLGIFVLMLLGSACIPIPSEAVLLFGGALASAGFAANALGRPDAQLGVVAVIVVALAGSMVGSWLSYAIGAKGGRPFIDRWGRYLLLRPHEVERAHVWFERHGEAAVFWSRMIPLARAFISLPAGVAGMPLRRFTLYTFLGNLPWTIGLVWAGYAAGDHWDRIERYLQPIGIVLAVVALALLVWWITRRLKARRIEAGPVER